MHEDRNGPAVMAMLAPAIVAFAGFGGFLLLAGGLREVVQLFQNGGFFSFAVLGCGLIGTVAACVLAFLYGSGRAVPLAAPAAAALLPWIAGLAGTMGTMMVVENALASIEPSHAGLLYAVGTGEALSTRAIGSWSSAMLLLGLALSAIVGAVPERRAGAWSSAAVLGAAGMFAAATAYAVLSLVRALTGAGMVEPSMRATLVAAGVAEAALGRTAQLGGAALAGVAILIAVALGAVQRRLLGALALGILVVTVAGIDFGFDRFGTTSALRLARPLWAEIPDFEPLSMAASGRAHLHGVLTPNEVRLTGEPPIPLAGLAEALGRVTGGGDTGEIGFTGGLGRSRALGLAVDSRTGGPMLRAVFDAAAQSGIHAVHLGGRTGGDVPTPQPLGPDGPYLALLSAQIVTVEVRTAAAAPDEDPHLFHAELAGPLLAVKKPDGTPLPETGMEGAYVRLILRDSATAADLAAAAERLHARGLLPVVVPALPAPTTPPPDGPGMLGSFAAPTGEAGGSLAPDVIKRVMKRRAKEIRRCYERRLAKRPTLEGKLTVTFRIEADGQVGMAEIGDSSLADAAVEKCITGVLKKTRFPKPFGGPVRVSYPFVFRRA